MADMEVPEKVRTPTRTKGGKELVTPAACVAELELQVQNLEKLVVEA